MKKHNKLKNTAIIFELLCKQLTYEVLQNQTQHSSKIIKKFFNKDTELLSELKLYQSLYQPNEKMDVSEMINVVPQMRKGLDNNKLDTEKYQLVKAIKSRYDLNEFFGLRLSNYKLLASIHNLLENTTDPNVYVQSKATIMEHHSRGKTETVNEVEVATANEDPAVKRLLFKLIVEKFNEKYKNLLPSQKRLLSRYINEDVAGNEFKNFVVTEANSLKATIQKKSNESGDPILSIKLTEVANLLDTITTSRGTIKEEHLSAMLKYYELVEEI
jgi:hypothetical protein